MISRSGTDNCVKQRATDDFRQISDILLKNSYSDMQLKFIASFHRVELVYNLQFIISSVFY